jgi:hypothetical protein
VADLIATTKPRVAPRLARRVRNLEDLRIAILVNGHANAEVLAREIAQCYIDRHQCTITEVVDKGVDATAPYSEDGLKQLGEQCDFLISAVGDSESSTECQLQESFTLELMGTPVLSVCTREFKPFAEKTVAEFGMADYPLIAVHHPIAGISESEMSARALHAYQQGWATLTGVFKING